MSENQENYLSALDTIIHESVHAFQALKGYIAENEPSSEFEAYTTAHIATTLIAEYTAYIGKQGEDNSPIVESPTPSVP